MATNPDPHSARALLTGHLAALRAERDQALAGSTLPNAGDVADRTPNVDAEARLVELDRRIAALEDALNREPQSDSTGTDRVSVGRVVTVDLGGGPESFLLAPVAVEGADVISLHSPLGQALQGSSVGATLSYTASNRTRHATVLAVH